MKVFLLCLFLVAVYAKELEGMIELTPNAKVTFKGNTESLILAGVFINTGGQRSEKDFDVILLYQWFSLSP